MITLSKWITFNDISDLPPYKDKKTKTFTVLTKDTAPGPYLLGEIKWFSPWRKYAFFPNAGIVFETICLSDIILFISSLMSERRVKKLEEKILKS